MTTDPYAAWRHPFFRLYFGLRFSFTMATMMQSTIIGFYVYQLTHSKLHLACIGLSELFPALILGLYGGYLTDRSEKRKMLLWIYSVLLLSTLLLLLLTWPGLFPLPAILAGIYILLFVNGSARAFYEPAMQVVSAASVPLAVYANASTWNNVSWQAAFILGPGLGALLYALAGVSGITATLITVILFIIVALILVLQLVLLPARSVHPESVKDNIIAGIRFVLGQPAIRYAMLLDLAGVLFGGLSALLPVYALDILHTGVAGLGIMRMAQSAGAALMMLALIRFSPMGKAWRNLLIAVAGFGLSIIGFGLSRLFWLSLLFLFLQGAFDSVSVLIRSTLLQVLTPEDMRGRVSALNGMCIGSSVELGNVESGLAAKSIGTIPAVIFGGTMTLLAVLFTFLKTRKLLSRKGALLSEAQAPSGAA